MPATSIAPGGPRPRFRRAPLPPGPRRGLFPRDLLAFRRDPLAFLTGAARTYGDVVHFRVGPRRVVLLSHPDDVKDLLVTNDRMFVKGRGLERAKRLLGEGLLTSEGDDHRRQRRLAQPAFHRARVASYARVMAEYAERHAARWRDGETLDVAAEAGRLTLAIVGKTLFDADVEAEADEIGGAVSELVDLFGFVMLPLSEWLENLPLPRARRFDRARARLDATVLRVIEERRAGPDRGDLLSMLMLARDGDGEGPGMSDERLRDEAMTIFLAGHETTANALAWTWYLLARHPEVEARLHEEVDRVLGARLPGAEDVAALPVAGRVLAESMRLYPPAWVVGRRALADYDVGGYAVPAGSIVAASQFVVHRDARFYPDPERFDPDRWTPEMKAALPKFAYFPFGGGPRQCIGESFARMEGVLLLATVARRWRMRLVPGHSVEPRPGITLRPKRGIRMTLERRGGGSR